MKLMRTGRRGFTLIELLLVVFILALLAASTSSLVDGAHSQARYDDTRTRLELIRSAIVGPEDLTAPVAGFVADMGRPPDTIRELLTDVSNDPYSIDATWRVGSGWRGPYLRAIPRLADGGLEFPDGWGTPNGAIADDFGWLVTPDLPQPGDRTITSLGSDAAPGPVSTTPLNYAVDVSLTVSRRDHHVNLTEWPPVEVVVRTSTVSGVTLALALRLRVPDGAGGFEWVDGTPKTVTLVANVDNVVTLDFAPPDPWMPHGVRAVELCTSNGATPPVLASIPDPSDPVATPQQFVLVNFRARASFPTRLSRIFRVP